MPLLTSKSQLEALTDLELENIATVVGGWACMYNENGQPINWWPIPWGPFRWWLKETLYGEAWYVRHFCTVLSEAETLAARVGLTVDPSWTARQVVIESIWHADQNTGS